MTISLMAGALPVAPLRRLHNEVTDSIERAVQNAIRTNSIGIISGPTGVGKTTTAALAGGQDGGPVAYVSITAAARPRQNMVSMFEAVTGTPARGTAPQVQADLHDHLLRNPTTMLIDEADFIDRTGLVLIMGLFNLVTTTRGTGTPVILIGNNLEQHLCKQLPELLTRSNAQANARPLTGNEIVQAVRVIEPRTQNNDAQMLFDLNKTFFKSNLKQWEFFFINLGFLTEPSLTEPYTERNIRDALIAMGQLQPKARKR